MEQTRQTAIESLREQFKNANDMEKIIINNCLLPEINNNPEFADRIIIEGKTISDMEKKIMEWVRQSKHYSPSHNVIFSLALHYYQEDTPGYIKELHEEEPLEFGNIQKEFNTPIVKYITGTVIQEVIKEVEKKIDTKIEKPVSSRVRLSVEEKIKAAGQQALF